MATPASVLSNFVTSTAHTATTTVVSAWNGTRLKRVFQADEQDNLPFVTLKATALGALVVWTIVANVLVFVVLYKNPRLQTVPNFLVGNLAFSDLCLGLVVLPLAAIYAVTLRWSFGKTVCEIWLSSDVLCSTASIWNLSIIGLDRYWAITSPITYMTKRTMRSAVIMIAGVWAWAMLISVAPFFGWRNSSEKGNYVLNNDTLSYQCVFLDLPAYSLYSATGSFFIPLTVMFFVYFQIYRAFAEHKARHLYRQKVLKKHIESTILHEISHVMPVSIPIPICPPEEFDKDNEDYDDDDDDSESDSEEAEEEEEEGDGEKGANEPNHNKKTHRELGSMITASTIVERTCSASLSNSKSPVPNGERLPLRNKTPRRLSLRRKSNSVEAGHRPLSNSADTPNHQPTLEHRAKSFTYVPSPNSNPRRPLIRPDRASNSKTRYYQPSQHRRRDVGASTKKAPAISAAKEKRGVKVLGIILGCFTICWTPFFIMYLATGLCQRCRPNAHVEQFITWLGYSNSAMNPIIYTVFNRDYQTALKRLFGRGTAVGAARKRRPQAV